MITTTVNDIPVYTITVRCKNCDYAVATSSIYYKYYCRKHMIDFNDMHRTYLVKEYINNDNNINNNQSK